MKKKIEKNKSVIDRYKGSGKSLAQISKEIGDKYKNRDTDITEKAAFETELLELEKFQEQLRLQDKMEEAINKYLRGGKIKYEDGGIFKDVNGNPIVINNSNDGQISYPDIPAVPFGTNPFGGMSIPSSSNYEEPTYGTRPETISSYRKSVLTPGTTVRPFDDAVYNRPSLMDIVKKLFAKDKPFKDVGEQVNVIDNNQGMSTPKDNPNTTRDSSAYTPALLGQGLSTLLNAGILAQGYDKVDPVNNPYEEDVKRLMQERGIDTTQQRNQILSAYNAGKQNLNNVRSANIRNALDANLMNITQDSLAESKLQEQVANNQFKSDLSNILNNLGQQKVQATTYADELTARNKGQFQSNLSQLGANIADNAKFFTEKKFNEVQNKMLSDMLSNKYTDVGLTPDMAKRLSEGKLTPDDITILKNKYGETETNNLIEVFKVKPE